MRKIVMFLVLSTAAAVFAHSLDDACVSFSTQGPDRYADGSTVLDGECYALVWSSDGKFEGFTAGGECADTNDSLVLVAPVAKDGRCPKVLFQISAEIAGRFDGGFYAVYLLDTRIASGGKIKPSGINGGKPVAMNGFASVSAELAVNAAEEDGGAAIGANGNGIVASSLAVPEGDCIQPKVKSMRIDGGNVYLTVENLKGFMRVQGGKSIGSFDSTGVAVETLGETEETVLVAPANGKSGFYKVVRSR